MKHKKKLTDEERWQRNHPYPRWCGHVTSYEYVIGNYDGKRAFQVLYHSTEMGNKDQAELGKMCKKHLRKVVEKEGGSNIGIIMVDEFCPEVKAQIGDDNMYYTEINGEQVGFDTMRLQKIMGVIVKAAKKHLRVQIKYQKKSGVIVTRLCACYSMKSNFLYVTDIKHGNEKIRGYDVGRIKAVKMSDKKFKPEWEIKL